MNLEIKFVIGILMLSGLTLVMTQTPNSVFAERVPFAVQNVTQSIPVPGFEDSFQIAPILPPREDGKFYTGTLSFTTNVPVEFTTLHQLNQTAQLQGFPVNIPGLNYTVSSPAPQSAETSDNRSFVASGVVLLYRNPTPFTVSYSLDGELVDPQPPPK
jgi:hypothetical protein